MHVRTETEADEVSVRAVNEAAFHSDAEAKIVSALRTRASPTISLVADDHGKVIGHIMFSPVALPGHLELTLMGLGPVAVVA